MKRRMNRLFRPDGKILIVAMDHTAFLDAPIDGLVRYGETVRATVAGGADAFLSPIGSVIHHADDYGPAAVIASVDTKSPFLDDAIPAALAAGADAVKAMIYPFADDARTNEIAALAARASAVGLPFLAEPVPGGFSAYDKRTPQIIAAGARIAAETGADFVKTFYTGDPESMKLVVEYAGVPVVMLGGHAKENLRDLFQEVDDAVNKAGVAGVAIGTNIWTSDNPGGVTAGLAAVIHDGANADDAVEVARSYAAERG